MAADPGIVRYIREQMDAGFRKAQIYEALLQAGWYKEEIDEAFYDVVRRITGAPEPPAPEFQAPKPSGQEARPELPKKAGFIWKVRNVLFRPGRFFEVVKKEKDIGSSLSFYGILSFIHTIIILTLFFLTEFNVQASLLEFIVQLFGFLAIKGAESLFFSYFILLAVPFLASAVIYFFVYVFRGSRGFHSAFKAVVYALTPTLLAWPIMVVFYFLPELTILGFNAFPILYGILLLGLWIWIFYLLIRGLKSFHEISSMKAVLATFIPLAISILVAAFLLQSSLMAFIGYLVPLENEAQPQAMSIIDHSYGYDGIFSLSVRDVQEPLTISTVSVGCGENDAYIDLDTESYTHLEPGDSIRYSTGSNKCVQKNPGEGYSVMVTIRYVDGKNSPNSFYKKAEGNVS